MAGLTTESLFGVSLLDEYLTYGANALQAAANDLANKGGGVLLIGTRAYPQQAGNITTPASVALWVLPGGRLPGTAGQTLIVNGTFFAAEVASTVFPGWGTATINGRAAVAGGSVNIPISAATPQAEAFGSAGAAGSTGNVSDAGHVHPLSNTAGGSLLGTYPNPGIANNAVGTLQLGAQAVGTAQLASGAVSGAQVASGAASNPTTTSTAYVDLPDMVLSITLPAGGDNRIIIVLQCDMYNGSAGQGVSMALSMDAAAEVAPTASDPVQVASSPLICVYAWSGLAGGTHSVKGRWAVVGSGTATALATRRSMVGLATWK